MKRKTSEISIKEALIGHEVRVLDKDMDRLIGVGQMDYPIDGDKQEVEEIPNVELYKKFNFLSEEK